MENRNEGIEQIREIIKQYLLRVNQQMKPVEEALANFQSKIKESLGTIDFSKLTKNYESFRDTIIKYGDSSQRFKTYIIEIGYPPSNYLLPYEIIEIVELFEKDKEQAILFVNKLMLKKFNSETLRVMLELWGESSFFQNRKSIFQDIIKAHELELYNVSIPTTIAQIEGVIAQGFNHSGMMGSKLMKEYMTKLLSDKDNYSFDEAVKAFYFEIVLGNFEHGKPIDSFLNRNAILHGGDVSYGTIENSLKSILLLDYVLEKITEYRQAG
ncbi:hypothetical protein [Paenibacillus camelliae]|uniref:hypothetical protein n=1 Tax=Paenibacillus camelliae TaxID=512410 RepID=UPI00203B95A6|nr:hypothetical protein [Paenibacillus camelliae]MCM3635296.1 hypothetical protein [Paenibacillus camelliae]